MTSRHHPVRLPRHGRGHTLVELMIALVLGLVLVGAVFVVFLGSRMSFNTSDNLSRMQDSARIAFALMGREIREASGTGCGLRATTIGSNAGLSAVPHPAHC